MAWTPVFTHITLPPAQAISPARRLGHIALPHSSKTSFLELLNQTRLQQAQVLGGANPAASATMASLSGTEAAARHPAFMQATLSAAQSASGCAMRGGQKAPAKGKDTTRPKRLSRR